MKKMLVSIILGLGLMFGVLATSTSFADTAPNSSTTSSTAAPAKPSVSTTATAASVVAAAPVAAPVSYTHLTLPTNREV